MLKYYSISYMIISQLHINYWLVFHVIYKQMRFLSFLPDLEVIKAAVRVVLHVKDGEVEQDLLPDGDTEGGGTHVLTTHNLN